MIEAPVEQVEDEVFFDIDGMTCASCAVRIERVLQRQDGVDSAVVNYAGQEAVVKAAAPIDVSGLESAIGKLGYRITPIVEGVARETPTEKYDAAVKFQRRNVAWAAVFTAPLLLLAWFGNGDTAAKVGMWALATPVVFVFGW